MLVCVLALTWLVALVYVGPARLALASGGLATLVGVVGVFNVIASTGGQGSPVDLLTGLGTSLVGLLYGVALAGLVYEPLAAAESLPRDSSRAAREPGRRARDDAGPRAPYTPRS